MCLNLLMVPSKRRDGLAPFFLLMGLPHIYVALRAAKKREEAANLKSRTWQLMRASLFTLGTMGIFETFS